MKRTAIVIAVLCVAALAADNATVAPKQAANHKPQAATSLKPQATSCGSEAITIPQMLSYQGMLTDTLGIPVPNDDYSVTFKLYIVPSGGSPFWSETQTVTTKAGLFSVLLGSVTPIGSMPDAGAVHLGMAAGGGSEMRPRLRLVSAAYSYKADTANYAGAAVPVGAAGGDLAGTYPSPTVDGLQGRSVSSSAPTADQVLKWNGSAWAPAADNAGGPPSGPAGGDLTGSYPNPTIAASAVGSAEIINGSLSGIDVSTPCTLNYSSTGTALRVNVPSAGRGIHAYRQSTTTTNPAIHGQTTAGSGAGVLGEATGDDGASVGVHGRTTPGTRPGVYGSNAPTGAGAPNVAAGVAAYSSSGPAFYVDSTATYGLRIRRSGSGGIHIDTVNGDGVSIARPGQDGIHVTNAPDDGIEVGDCTYGVYAHNAYYTGVIGDGQWGGVFTTTNAAGYGLRADAYNQAATDTAILAYGKGVATGGWSTGFKEGEAPCIVSDERTIIAMGSARTTKGKASAAFPALFTAHLKDNVPVRISLTPRGDPAGILCVSANDASGFSARLKTVPGWDGAGDVEFDWVVFGTLEEPQTSPTDQSPPEALKRQIPSVGTSGKRE